MKVYLIRHGESSTNLSGHYGGWAQCELTEKGRRDAARAGLLLRGLSFDKVYSSDLIRAMETQQIALPGAACERTPLVREIGLGTLTGRKVEECHREYGEALAQNIRRLDYSDYGGESHEAFRARLGQFLDALVEADYQNVAVFTHGGAIRTMVGVALDQMLVWSKFLCRNGSVTVLEYQAGTWRLNLWDFTAEELGLNEF